ncbi:MAG: peptidase inhibitor family I36 protein [Actinomycetota bacterium]|nr:peptidase inhibitor family I36 protein [Actinomycetota bacterium]
MTTKQPMTEPDRVRGRGLADPPTVRLRPRRYQGRRPLRDPANPPTGGWRSVLSVASVVTVALVPGAAMAVGSVAASASAVCGYGSFCLYSGPDFTGEKVEYDAQQLFCQGARPGLDVLSVLPKGVRSVYNNTGTAPEGLGVKIYTERGRVALPTVAPGREVRTVDVQAARDMRTLCAYPR